MRQRDIFRFWSPLFASWLLMAVEGPLISAVINRLGDEVIMLAAQGLVMSLSVIIESPIINLLATTTTLAQDRPSYLLIRKFTLHLMILLTAITLLFCIPACSIWSSQAGWVFRRKSPNGCGPVFAS